MIKKSFTLIGYSLVLCSHALQAPMAQAQSQLNRASTTLTTSKSSSSPSSSSTLSTPTILSVKELEKLTQSIALYPDILLQQILAASTFPEQLIDAALYHEQGKDPKGIVTQPWDQSVKGIANYPSILSKMVSDLDWTISLGYAFINQSQDLLKAIQSLRAKAKSLGNLKDSEQANVVSDANAKGEQIIRIESTNPEVVYVPVTTQTIIYEQPVSSSDVWAPVATFGLGMALGYAMGDNDGDDHYHYGGYYGPGFWYNDDAVNKWQDHRSDRWNDYADYQNDKQDWRQDNAEDWREYRQDLGKQRGDLKNMTPEQRAQAQSKAQNARSEWSQKSPEARQQALNARGVDTVSGRTGTSGSSPQVRQRTSPSYSGSSYPSPKDFSSRSGSGIKGGSLAGMGSSGSSVNRNQMRGATSRASSGTVSRGSSGMSRGGGGMSRGGGGRR